MSALPAARPLPPRPSLEFERKEAKALLRRLKRGDPDALARAGAQHPRLDPAQARLADAQLVIAREYGFASWPKLVRYFDGVPTTWYMRGGTHRLDIYEGSVRGLLAQHRDRKRLAARTLASYVPRLYAMPAEDVFAESISEDEARLAVARQYGFPSWQVLLERAAQSDENRDPGWELDLYRRAARAVGAGDLDALRDLAAEHPELLHPSEEDRAVGRNLMTMALHHEMRGAPVRHIVDWVAAQGFDLQHELNAMLCATGLYTAPDDVRRLLDRGADPSWVAPNGSTVLEHAIILYWNGAAVDVLAERARPRRALWIAAGLGDVDAVRRFLDRDGMPTADARRIAPPDVRRAPPTHPDPGPEEILLEAFLVAMVNGRTQVMEYLASRGFDPNTLLWDSPVINIAAGNAWPAVIASLLRCGANPDIKGYRPTQSAREIARQRLIDNDRHPGVREVAELLGMNPDAVLAEHDAQAPTPVAEPKLLQALALASDDAFRRAQREVEPENLLFGLLRAGGLPLMFFTGASRMDVERFRADVADRVAFGEERAEHDTLPMRADAQAAVDSATAVAKEWRRDTVLGIHLLYALTRSGEGVAADLLARYGSSAAVLNAELERGM